jgi:CheY-like chemotaxis protein
MKNITCQEQATLDELIGIETSENLQNVDGMKVMLVDASPERIKTLQDILLGLKLNITKSLIGNRALRLFNKNTPDLILLDVDMLGMDSYDICQMITNNNKSKPVPIIYITSTSKTAELLGNMSLGAVDYIFKPLNEEEVLHRVHNQLALRKSIFEQQSMIEQPEFTPEKHELLINVA